MKCIPLLRCVFAILAVAAEFLHAPAVHAAEANSLILDHLTAADGLPQSTVYATLQDSQGFVWLATEDGLVRYDGQTLVRYAYSRTGTSLPGNFIRQFVEDAHHDIWIALKDAGVARWNRTRDDFTVFRHDPKRPESLASDTVRAITIDKAGIVWIGTSDAGLDAMNPVSGSIEHFQHSRTNADSLGSDAVFGLTIDSAGRLWIATDNGLDEWRPSGKGFRHLRHSDEDNQSLSSNQISQVTEDRNGDFWVGTFDGGLNHMRDSGTVFDRYLHTPTANANANATATATATATTTKSSLASDDVRAVLEDRAGRVWVGTTEGLDLIEPTTHSVTHYQHNETDADSLRDSYIMSLYEDHSGLLWIGTREAGVSRWNPRSWELNAHRPSWLAGKQVTSFAKGRDQGIWIGSVGGGLKYFDDASGTAIDIDQTVGKKNALGDLRVMALATDNRDNLWIGTMTSGLRRLRPDGQLDTYGVRLGDAHGVSAEGIMTLYRTRSDDIWIGTYGGGVNVIDARTGRVRQLPHGTDVPESISSPNVAAIAEDARGNLWFGTDGGGLNYADRDGRVLHVFRHDPADPRSIPSNTIYAITVDGAGTVWVATDKGGLARVTGQVEQPESVHFETFSRENGLSSETIYAALDDGAGHLWLSGNAGLMRFDTTTHAVKSYHRENGVQGEEFDLNAYLRLPDGRLCFGGPGGFNIFNPSHLTYNSSPPRVALTRLEVLGAPLATKIPYWLLDHVDLDYHASIVSLDFSALDFTAPKRNRLAYRVADLSDKWIDLDTQRRVTLTNLDPGVHQLEVRAANADAIWSEPIRVAVSRAPAPWRSAVAYTLYALALLLFALFRWQKGRQALRQVQIAKQRLESEVVLRTAELRESNQQLQEASRAKSNFLARMSHELRTPMNGVVGSTELLSRTELTPSQSRLTRTIRASSQVLLQIVNDLLDLSKVQAGRIELECLPLDLVSIVEECATLFAATAASKNVEIIIDPPALPPTELEGDALRIRQIVMNLVGNAVKFTPQGTVTVRAQVNFDASGAAQLQVFVSDTGIGMDAKTIEKIFEPFTQADESTTRRFGGSGLGLAICRELANCMGGSITAESRPGAGSVFRVELPLTIGAQRGEADFSGTHSTLRILTRRPDLHKALCNHAAALEHRIAEETAPLPVGTVLLIDAATNADALTDRLDAGEVRFPVVLMASESELQALGEPAHRKHVVIVQKPVLRAELGEAIRAAGGTAAAANERTPTTRVDATFKGHVLLVEDEPVNATIAQGYLNALGCTFVWVSTGAEGVARCASERFDLIMMDLNMPIMDGMTATRLIRAKEPATRRTPIVALTAHQAKDYRQACLDAGMDELLSKPYTFDECARLLARFLCVERPTAASYPDLQLVDAKTVVGLRKLRRTGSTDLYASLVSVFVESSCASIESLRTSVQQGNQPQMAAICHKLAAAAANVGALNFAHQARQLELLCAGEDTVRIAELSGRLIQAHPGLCEELAELTLRIPA